jgi:2-haloacid dehalogenase
MTYTVCFDALGTCFTLEPVIAALEELVGEQLKPVGGARMIVMDWASVVSPPTSQNSF